MGLGLERRTSLQYWRVCVSECEIECAYEYVFVCASCICFVCVCALFVSMFCVVMEDFMMLVLMFLVRGDLTHDRRLEKRRDMLLAATDFILVLITQ